MPKTVAAAAAGFASNNLYIHVSTKKLKHKNFISQPLSIMVHYHIKPRKSSPPLIMANEKQTSTMDLLTMNMCAVMDLQYYIDKSHHVEVMKPLGP